MGVTGEIGFGEGWGDEAEEDVWVDWTVFQTPILDELAEDLFGRRIVGASR